ncbi:hypothetical protein LEP1GSC062_1314 [Leptospira alexanderi serovar Manhao 3 str. L 60]|uniref:Uncharacterized protein n=1 Tax=Leptospira alexanderi serovar Manhao 3 str. L 60 TaxID=1049759 RepID=V6I5T6_9LEPT|nr:hypothetical protein LEP1GSC062_1314 [Leptospira alexanderi serovar Manhao 3 str. L 60]
MNRPQVCILPISKQTSVESLLERTTYVLNLQTEAKAMKRESGRKIRNEKKSK